MQGRYTGKERKKKRLTFLLFFISSTLEKKCPLGARFQFLSTVFINPDIYMTGEIQEKLETLRRRGDKSLSITLSGNSKIRRKLQISMQTANGCNLVMLSCNF